MNRKISQLKNSVVTQKIALDLTHHLWITHASGSEATGLNRDGLEFTEYFKCPVVNLGAYGTETIRKTNEIGWNL